MKTKCKLFVFFKRFFNIIISEIHVNFRTPSTMLIFSLQNCVFHDHPYGKKENLIPPICNTERINTESINMENTNPIPQDDNMNSQYVPRVLYER